MVQIFLFNSRAATEDELNASEIMLPESHNCEEDDEEYRPVLKEVKSDYIR